MNQMTPSQARVIDPILTEVARAAAMQGNMVADVLFPIVPVGARGGRIISFGAEHFKLDDSARAPGANTKREQFGYSSSNYALVDYSREGAVPIELLQEASAVPGIDLASQAIAKVTAKAMLEREKQSADLALNADSYGASNKATLSGATQWSHADSNPFTAIANAREAVRAQIGIRPDVLTIGPAVRTALANHPLVLARLRGGAGADSTDRAPATLVELARVFDLRLVVEGSAIYHNGTAFVDVWGKHAVLAYTTPMGMADMGSPSYGYTYQLRNYPVAEQPYYDRNSKTWYFPVTDARAPVLVGPAAGFLFTNAAA